MKKKKPAQLYFKMFWSYTAIVLCIVSALVVYFISDSKKRVLENNRMAMERINREASDYIRETEEISDYLFQDLYRSETELEDLLAYLKLGPEEYLEYGLDRYSAEDNLVYRGIYNFINDAFEGYGALESIEVISYDTLNLTQCYPQQIFYPGKDVKARLEEIERPDFREEGKLLYIKEIRNPDNMTGAGCMIFTFEGESRFQNLQDNRYTELTVCNQNDQVIYQDPPGENWKDRLEDSRYLTLKESENLYTVYTFLNSSQASKLSLQTLAMILAAGVAAAALGILGIGYYVRRLTRRVDSILYAMNQVTTGNLQSRLKVNKKGDELDMVAEQFNRMCEDLNLYIQKSYLAEIERKNAQMQALQSQINPHFLYNTLEAIRMKAICNGDREVGKMLYSMVTLFRSQLKEADVITLGQELDYCKQYMELFEYRYQGCFSSQVSCPVELLTVPIIKFVLQPIVENYFVHGIERDRKDNLVKIWARAEGEALKLDVEEYILKPINEEQLCQALISAGEHLDKIDRENAGSMEDKIGWHRFLKGKLNREEEAGFMQMLPEIGREEKVYPSLMKVDTGTLKDRTSLSDVLAALQKEPEKIKAIYLAPDTLFLLLYTGKEVKDREITEFYRSFQDRLESRLGIMSFLTVTFPVEDYGKLPKCYDVASRLQKYKMLEGYGSCISEEDIQDRKWGDISIDESLLRKMILKKEREGAIGYIEDLFINNLESEVTVDVLYQTALKIVMLLQDIKAEYKLAQSTNLQGFSEMIEKIYQAEDLRGLKAVFISEISEIITHLHTEDSQYTPVVRQIMEEVQKNYKEDMNLKTLSYKYHMNASYLGQIFQKETGSSFAQYLNNVKNSIAKNLILNTNMKINDIAREVGYPDTSYFYRKFKQCYGVSPASLRNMKKY